MLQFPEPDDSRIKLLFEHSAELIERGERVIDGMTKASRAVGIIARQCANLRFTTNRELEPRKQMADGASWDDSLTD